MMIANRKGNEFLSPWWVGMLILVGVAVTIGTTIFYSSDVDVREIEVSLLLDRLSRCVLDNSDLNEDNVFEKCSLAEERFDSEQDLYFEITYFERNSEIKKIEKGDDSMGVECDIITRDDGSKIEAEGYLVCDSKRLLIDGESIMILAGSNNRGVRL